jgi:hypothetical protein
MFLAKENASHIFFIFFPLRYPFRSDILVDWRGEDFPVILDYIADIVGDRLQVAFAEIPIRETVHPCNNYFQVWGNSGLFGGDERGKQTLVCLCLSHALLLTHPKVAEMFA